MDLIQTIAKTGKQLADKAKDVYDVNKINIQIHNEEKEINREYIKLAKKYMEKYEQEIDPDFIGFIEEIQKHKENIEELRIKKEMVKNSAV